MVCVRANIRILEHSSKDMTVILLLQNLNKANIANSVTTRDEARAVASSADTVVVLRKLLKSTVYSNRTYPVSPSSDIAPI